MYACGATRGPSLGLGVSRAWFCWSSIPEGCILCSRGWTSLGLVMGLGPRGISVGGSREVTLLDGLVTPLSV